MIITFNVSLIHLKLQDENPPLASPSSQVKERDREGEKIFIIKLFLHLMT